MTAAIKRSDPKYLQINASSLRETESPLVPDSRSGIAAPSLQPGELDRLYRSLFEVTPEDHPRTARLLASSNRKTAQKVIEEAGEVALEAVKHHARGIVRESADLLYHLVALWYRAGIDPSDVWIEMRCRADTLGIAEKLPKTRAELLNPERQATDQNSTGINHDRHERTERASGRGCNERAFDEPSDLRDRSRPKPSFCGWLLQSGHAAAHRWGAQGGFGLAGTIGRHLPCADVRSGCEQPNLDLVLFAYAEVLRLDLPRRGSY
jgi:phosphoribosyl-ATP pyrophosphohydrolase